MSIVDGINEVPFKVDRVFWIYDIPAGESRGAHAHKECHQFIIAASGSFEVEADNGTEKKTFYLNRPFYGLHVPPGIWAHEFNFSAGAICLVLHHILVLTELHKVMMNTKDSFGWKRLIEFNGLLLKARVCILFTVQLSRTISHERGQRNICCASY